ncbi:MAG: hypothetical protein P8Y60_00370 [Calditrichota bacterium]|jgi:hypothetical protein
MSEEKFIHFNIAGHKVTLWIITVLITISSAVYQRLTGPTYPVRGKILFSGTEINFKLLRTETTDRDALIKIEVPDTAMYGYVKFKRYNSNDKWSEIPLKRSGKYLIQELPRQPAAGKLIYQVYLQENERIISLTDGKPVIIRFKGHVPEVILIPHILLMFLAMLFSNRTALEALDPAGNAKRYMLWTIGLFLVGGFILGPLVQKYAFGDLWTGIPIGYDLTDNKTLIAMLGWLWAWLKNSRGQKSRGWIFFAAILMLAVYLIPHSVFGSEIDYTQGSPAK